MIHEEHEEHEGIVGAIPCGRPQVSRDIWAYANGVCFYQANYGIADF